MIHSFIMQRLFFVALLVLLFGSFQTVEAGTETLRVYALSGDGQAGVGTVEGLSSWEEARSYEGEVSYTTQDTEVNNTARSDKVSGAYRIYRGTIPFDTSILPENAVIDKAVLGLHAYPGAGSTGSAKACVSTHNRVDPSNVVGDDYHISRYSNNPIAPTKILLEGQYTEFNFDDIGINHINRAGYSSYGIRTDFDCEDREPLVLGAKTATWRSSETPGIASDPYLEITYTIPDEPEEVDPLVLQYAPTLAFFKDVELEEDYLPMDVEPFVERSALWDGGDGTQLYDASELDWGQFADTVDAEDTSEYYLAFSDPDESGSFDLDAAKAKYGALSDPNAVYYHTMDDGNYTVLQYWYFYAMNNWKQYGGVNNHEGDWESVFVFLDKDTLEPQYVAYSAHLNDGFTGVNPKQYGSVRREWDSDEVEKSGDTVTSYVALGSHANYPVAGRHRVLPSKFDLTSETGVQLDTSTALLGNEISEDDPFWMRYMGKWGADIGVLGASGPEGPQYIAVTGQERFFEPVRWAGIDLIDFFEALGGELEAIFAKAKVHMKFKGALDNGIWIKVDPHEENIFFGTLPRGVTLLPKFWDITSNLENGTFEAEVFFEYIEEQVEELGGDERTLRVFFYDPEADAWIPQMSKVDTVNNKVSFKTTHFSRYALGFTEPDVLVGDIFDQIIAIIDDSELSMPFKRNLIAMVERLREKVDELDKRSAIAKETLVKVFTGMLDNKKYAAGFLENEIEDINTLLTQLMSLIGSR